MKNDIISEITLKLFRNSVKNALLAASRGAGSNVTKKAFDIAFPEDAIRDIRLEALHVGVDNI